MASALNFANPGIGRYPFLNFSEDPTGAVVSLAAIEHEIVASSPEISKGGASTFGRKRVVAMGRFEVILILW